MVFSISTLVVVLLWVTADAYHKDHRAHRRSSRSSLDKERNELHLAPGYSEHGIRTRSRLDIERRRRREIDIDAEDEKRMERINRMLRARGDLHDEALENANKQPKRRIDPYAREMKKMEHINRILRARGDLHDVALENANKQPNRRIDPYVREIKKMMQINHRKRTQDSDIAALVNAHNDARRKVDPTASNMLKMKWDDKLAQAAQAHADNCIFKHSNTSNGENLFATSGSLAMAEGVNGWDAEKANYNYDNNTCNTGKVCGHYTQVVWAASNKVGCGWRQCSTLEQCGFDDCTNWNFLVCQYSPGGNFNNLKPYESGDSCSSCSDCCENKLCTKADCNGDDGGDDGGDKGSNDSGNDGSNAGSNDGSDEGGNNGDDESGNDDGGDGGGDGGGNDDESSQSNESEESSESDEDGGYSQNDERSTSEGIESISEISDLTK